MVMPAGTCTAVMAHLWVSRGSSSVRRYWSSTAATTCGRMLAGGITSPLSAGEHTLVSCRAVTALPTAPQQPPPEQVTPELLDG